MKQFIHWLGAAAVMVIIFGTIYAVVQQAQRSDANYPQIQIAEDTATALSQGLDPHARVMGMVDPSTSLAPFVVIYNKSGQAVAGSGYLQDHLLVAPIGILIAAQGKDYHKVTWEPQNGTRIAAVTVATANYYVLSGRSLKEVEKNEDKTFRLSLLGGLMSLGVLAVAWVGLRKF